MKIITIIGSCFLGVVYLRNVLSFISIWRIKEYRFDRMFVHVRTNGWASWVWPNWRKPPITPKTTALTILLFTIICIYITATQGNIIVRLIISNLLLFPVSALLVMVLAIPTYLVHWWKIRKATSILRRQQHLLVIGITGSYGKTSIKEYLSIILSTRYIVLKTEGSKNSPIAIAELVLRELTPQHEIFIVEMGAYKTGEIARMTAMVRPSIGIVTAINEQHQDLFGSIEQTMKAKYELIQGLRGKRIGIFNSSNAKTCEMTAWAQHDHVHIWTYAGACRDVRSERIFTASNIHPRLQTLTFTCIEGQSAASVSANVVGEHKVGNILAAIAASVAAGMTLNDACRLTANITSLPDILKITNGTNEAVFINDTSNNNPDAAIAALNVLSKYHGRKFLVFQPMIELGKYSDSGHEKVAAHAARICTEIYLTNNNFRTPFFTGIQRSGITVPVRVMSTKDIVRYFRKILTAKDAVLFKGKEAGRVLDILRKSR